MSKLHTLFKTNRTLETEGIYLQIDDGIKFKVKRFGGSNETKVKQAMNKHYKPMSRLIESGALSSKQENEIMVKVFVESCMLDWEGIEEDGKEVPYSESKAIALFTELPELFRVIMDYAGSTDNFREDLGNS